MTLPENFTPVQHLKDVLIKTYNKLVKEEFKDIDEELDPDITTPRSSLRTACLIDNNDSQITINNRLMLFYFLLRKASDLQAPIYGIPTGTYHETFKFKPQVCLYFHEDLGDVEDGYQPIRSRFTFRLMHETETSLSKTELTTLANKIKQEFGLNNGYKFKRGKVLCSYHDPEHGLMLKVLAWSTSEGKEVIKKIIDVANTTYDNVKFNCSVNENDSGAYPTIPPQKSILGKLERLPRKRPVGTVRFTHATCAIWGKTKPVLLYCRGNMLNGGLVE